MDRRRLGPRPAPTSDQRSAAYESIFGRPSATHHQPQPQPRPVPSNGVQYSQSIRREPMPGYGPPNAYGLPAGAGYRQPPGAVQPGYNYNPQYNPGLVPPSVHSRARSFAGSPHSGIIVPQPQIPSDPGLEHLTRQGLTPAQAYQAQIYLNNPPEHPPVVPPRLPVQQHQTHSPPRLDLLAINDDGGRLDLNFDKEPSPVTPVTQVTHRTDEDDSELPWATVAGQRTPTLDSMRKATEALNPPSASASTSASASPYPNGPQHAQTTPSIPHIKEVRTPGQPPKLNMSFGSLPPGAYSPFSPASSTDGSSMPRRSSESSRTMPPMPSIGSRRGSDRGRSMSATIPKSDNQLTHGSSPRPPRQPKRAPTIYSALLSKVAEAFRSRITLGERTKNGLTYPDAFDGREAVDKICYIIKTTDRSLALLLGRALDAQKFFHDVTYDHRLRDNPNEIYQFRSRLPATFGGDDSDTVPGSAITATADGQSALSSVISGGGSSTDSSRPLSPVSMTSTHESRSKDTYATSSVLSHEDSIASSATSASTHALLASDGTVTSTNNIGRKPTARRGNSTNGDDAELPTGVFTMLTECYSSTCTRDRLCYSITCPRRMEQQARLNKASSSSSNPSARSHQSSTDDLKPTLGGVGSSAVGTGGGVDVVEDEDDIGVNEPGTLWIHSVPKEIADTLSDTEKKRQEAINEVIYTERDFVRDMEYLNDVWVAGIQNSDVIPHERRSYFISQVFWNLLAIIEVNTRLRDALSKRQEQFTVVGEIGDIFREYVPHFDPFVEYGAHQLYGKYEFEKEKGSNPQFAAWVEEIERLPESRKLELNGYLTKPTTRLARYPLLLEAVLKHTPDNSPDKVALPEVITEVKAFLTKVNQRTGETENRFHLHQLERQLVFRAGEFVDLKLSAEQRQLIYKGPLNRRGGPGDREELQVFLFDHAVLMVKQKTKGDVHKVYRRPIPLELLIVSASEEPTATLRGHRAARPSTARPSLTAPQNAVLAKPDNRNGFPMNFTHLGWRGYSVTLWAPTFISRKKWLENIQKQQDLLKERSLIFETVPFSEGFFTAGNRVNCAAPFYGGRKIAYGTDDGVYFSDFREGRDPIKMLALLEVTQIDILEEYQLLVVLSERAVITFPLDALDAMDPTAALKRGKRIASHTSFFQAGTCLNRTLVCVVKTSALSTTVKVFEPIHQNVRGKNKPTFKKLLQGGHDTLRLFREFYIPVESHSLTMLKTRLCMGCTKGFLIVDLQTLDTQPLVDPADPSLEFIEKKDNLRPLAIFRVDGDFLLCYDEWAVFVDKRGFRARGDWRAIWEGRPTAFAFQYPYVIAFEPNFIEVRDIKDGSIAQIITGENLRCLFAEPPPSTLPGAPGFYGQAGAFIQGQYGQNFGHPYGPGSAFSPYPGPGQGPPHMNMAQQGLAQGHGNSRREILLVGDDAVMFLKRIPIGPSMPGPPNPGAPISANGH